MSLHIQPEQTCGDVWRARLVVTVSKIIFFHFLFPPKFLPTCFNDKRASIKVLFYNDDVNQVLSAYSGHCGQSIGARILVPINSAMRDTLPT